MSAPPPSAEPDADCLTCEPAERWSRPNRAHITITDELTGQSIRVCGGCLEAGVDSRLLVDAAPTEAAQQAGGPPPAPARA